MVLKTLIYQAKLGQIVVFVHFSICNKKRSQFEAESIGISGCGGKTRTYDLRVMSILYFI